MTKMISIAAALVVVALIAAVALTQAAQIVA